MSKTNFEAITPDAQGLGRFLRSLPVLEAPWDTEFQKRYCSGCVAAACVLFIVTYPKTPSAAAIP